IARLRRDRTVLVVGALDSQISHRARTVFVRLRCTPGAGNDVAYPLAQWREAGSVKLLTGSVDCVAELAYTSNEHLYRVLMKGLLQLHGVVGTFSIEVLRRFPTPHSWNSGFLPDEAVVTLAATRRARWRERPEPYDVAAMSA